MGGRVEKLMQNMYLVSYIVLLDPLNGEKRPNLAKNEGSKIRIDYYEAKFAFKVPIMHSWVQKLVC